MSEERIESEEKIAVRPVRHRKPQAVQDIVFKIRQILNVLFMVIGVIGGAMYSGYFGDGRIIQMGGILVIIAISMKMAECVLRYKKPTSEEE